jgi:hypothetical protein
MNRQKAVPIRVRTKSRGIVGAPDRSLYAGFLISETPIRLTNPQPNRPNQDNLPPMRLNEGRAHKHQALLASVLEGGFKVEVVPSQERL